MQNINLACMFNFDGIGRWFPECINIKKKYYCPIIVGHFITINNKWNLTWILAQQNFLNSDTSFFSVACCLLDTLGGWWDDLQGWLAAWCMARVNSGYASWKLLVLTFVSIPSSRWFFCRTCWSASWIFCCSFSIFTFSCSHERSKHERWYSLLFLQHDVGTPPFLLTLRPRVLYHTAKLETIRPVSLSFQNFLLWECKTDLWQLWY